MSKPKKDQFLNNYNITEGEFSRTNLKWAELLKIYDDHLKNYRIQVNISNYIFETLSELENVHSIRKRIKDPEHLMEKIIRKSLSKPESEISLENYTEKITDLIGVRVLHLYKDDWLEIHNKILSTWSTVEKPTANIRRGDNEEVYLENGCEIKEHQYGYRSVHYLIEFPYTKDSKMIVEIQVRTLFEEAWSEIDHKIRYPYDIDNPILAGYLVVFNSLAGSADQMGSFIKILKQELDLRNQQIEEKDMIIRELKEEINKSKLDKQDKERINKSLNKIFIDNFDTTKITKALSQSIISMNSLNINSDLFKLSTEVANAFKKLNNININPATIENNKNTKNEIAITSEKKEGEEEN
ncbi:hypothetical protein YDYSG_03350 [Paenibacillus tyrfis]|uniref:GTP pyrophosphokinase n=1 Tax=Paenibacillus tyrfis TaxID=1501230 RepID=UPI00249399CE|nr:GTP pyrophosphokinase [Paenibacillus tyrfis]GLI04305.1 hypothetical protein YDYSG_03350 [Paenibacillus tyrfis]